MQNMGSVCAVYQTFQICSDETEKLPCPAAAIGVESAVFGQTQPVIAFADSLVCWNQHINGPLVHAATERANGVRMKVVPS